MDEIAMFAKKFRKTILKTPIEKRLFSLRDFPRGSCGDTTLLLAEYLKNNGYGPFDYVGGEREGKSHAWLNKDSLIIDITADQFDDNDNEVIVTHDSLWHKSFVEQIRHKADISIYDEYTKTTLFSAYQTILAHINF